MAFAREGLSGRGVDIAFLSGPDAVGDEAAAAWSAKYMIALRYLLLFYAATLRSAVPSCDLDERRADPHRSPVAKGALADLAAVACNDFCQGEVSGDSHGLLLKSSNGATACCTRRAITGADRKRPGEFDEGPRGSW
jgi:hypothetical protein